MAILWRMLSALLVGTVWSLADGSSDPGARRYVLSLSQVRLQPSCTEGPSLLCFMTVHNPFASDIPRTATAGRLPLRSLDRD